MNTQRMAMNVDDSDKKDAIIFRQVLTSIFIMASHWKDIIKVNAQLVEAAIRILRVGTINPQRCS
jgi:hypothetical protein